MVDSVKHSVVAYHVLRNDRVTNAVIAGYEMTRFGVPMIGDWDNEGRSTSFKRVTISPAVPGAQYRIIAWALAIGDGRRSATPAVVDATAREASKTVLHMK